MRDTASGANGIGIAVAIKKPALDSDTDSEEMRHGTIDSF